MSYLKSGGSSPFSPSPAHVIGSGSWRVFLGGPHVGTCHFRSATLGGGGRLGLPSCWRGQRGASYCRLCRAKTVRRCFTRLEYKFCLRLYFVDAKILSTYIFCWCQYFVDAYILLTPIFCWCVYFDDANILSTKIICWRIYFVDANILLTPIFSWRLQFTDANILSLICLNLLRFWSQ